jgi:3'(2'), 5'-bisphosphate nucleotidase
LTVALSSTLERIHDLARAAGEAVMSVYARGEGEAGLAWKDDRSPLTEADLASHRVIVEGLREITPDVHVVSEEDAQHAANARVDELWLVDPLDGTKEFLKRSGEFTVNIALVRGGRPVAGVVHAPALGRSWIGTPDGAELRDFGGGAPPGGAPRAGGPPGAAPRGAASRRDAGAAASTPIRVRRADPDALVLVASRDHAGALVRALVDRLPGAATSSVGSSLKFCQIAEGRADLYLRDGPTMEWDTAAAQAVLEAAGGGVYTLGGDALVYGKTNLKNPSFIAVGDRALDWRGMLPG